MSVNSERSFLEKCFTLFDILKEVRFEPTVDGHNNYSNRVKLLYKRDGKSSLFIIEFTPSCLEVYGQEEVHSELINTITKALSGAQHQQYNTRTHYWSGKVINNYFLRDKD